MKTITLNLDTHQAEHLLLGLEHYLEHLHKVQKELSGIDIEDIDTFEILINELNELGIKSDTLK